MMKKRFSGVMNAVSSPEVVKLASSLVMSALKARFVVDFLLALSC